MVLAAGFSLAKDPGTGYVPEGFDELTKQKGHFKKTLIRPDADFSRYSKLYPRKVMLQFREPKPPGAPSSTGSLVRKRSKAYTPPSYQDLAKFRQIINDAIVNELERSGAFQLVHDVGPDTLVLRASFIDVVSDISSKSSSSDESQVPATAQGEIFFDLIDAETGVIQARIGERRKCRKENHASSSGDCDVLWANVCAWAEHTAADLCRELERVRNGETG